jgi:hypothetical protein
MGWTFGWGHRRLLVDHLTKPREDGHGRTNRCVRKFFSGNDLWTVWETSETGVEDIGSRWTTLFLLRRIGGDWGYKGIEECMGPTKLTCPPAFLDMVPDPGGYATEWRERVRAYQARRNRRVVIDATIALGGPQPNTFTVTSLRPLRARFDAAGSAGRSGARRTGDHTIRRPGGPP